MNDMYRINPNIDVPIYKQLVDIIESAIKKGELAYGERLPTVQDMIDRLANSRNDLDRENIIKKLGIEILAACRASIYYFCRGCVEPEFYRWLAGSRPFRHEPVVNEG